MHIPGAAWVALIMAIIGWLQGDWFAGQEWVPFAIILLSAAAQIINVLVEDHGMTRSMREVNGGRSKLSRILWGS